MFRVFLPLCAVLCLAAGSDLTGLWELSLRAPGGQALTVELSFARANGQLTGSVRNGGSFVPLQDVKENSDGLSFQATNDDGKVYSFQLKFTGDTLSGAFSGPQGISGACTANRKPPAAAQGLAGDFLAKNSQPLDVNDLQASLIDTGGKTIFLLGEAHGMAINDDLDLGLLRYLHKNAGVRVYLAEWGYAAGRLMDRYVETGDERLLDFLVRQSRGTISWTKEHRAFMVKFRDWNLTLPERERVRVVGLDIEHQPQIAVWYLRDLAARSAEAPATIREIVSSLTQLEPEKTTDAACSKLANELAASLNQRRREYAGWLGDQLLEFEVVATNLQKRYQAYADREKRFTLVREGAMYDTFLKLQPMLAGTKCYGRWGAAHVAQRRYQDRDAFAARLNRPDSPAAGKVATIWPLHKNCEALQMTGSGYRTRMIGDDSDVLTPLAAAARSPLMLFKLTGAGSPFAKALYHFTGGSGGVTTDYAQYLLLIQDAKPAHLMEGSAAAPGPRPFVVKTEPAAESTAVAPGVVEIRITFSEDMLPKYFSFQRSMAGQHPQFLGPPALQADRRTFSVRVKVEPGQMYATWLNTARSQAFQSAAGEAGVPYLLVFKTAER